MSERNNQAEFYFHQGTNYHSYQYLGCNLKRQGNEYIYSFRTWAPNADLVSLVADFCGWETPIELNKISEKGIWEYIHRTTNDLSGNAYKFIIKNGNSIKYKGDPYAKKSRGGTDGASIIFTNSNYDWNDRSWLVYRKRENLSPNAILPTPLNIYEVHLGSFMHKENENQFLNYRELADVLGPYAKYMGYTHIEVMPIAEHPYDGSWGYQVGAFYAPSGKFGTPDDFKYFVDTLHCLGIGVILDWVGAHFPKDEWGLYEFDGSPLYEYQGNDRQESKSWGTRYFDLGREEVQCFLISNALYFFREFHIDGLRVDAVASMLYLDYDRCHGEWVPNSEGGRLSLEAVAFFQKLNTEVFSEFPDVLMIAEESGDYGAITRPKEALGLGFNLKWNMGWANDFFDYLSTDPIYRKHKHNALTFPIMYAFSENYILPISHDEVVHGKRAFIDKIFGNYEDKFSEMRCALLLMMTFPGKKLMFMGTEYAQFREWDYKNPLEWFMLDYKNHRAMREYTAALNRFYLENEALWYYDFTSNGFEWIYPDEKDKNTVAYKRHGKEDTLIIVINFSGVTEEIIIPKSSSNLECIFKTDTNAFTDIINKDEGETRIKLPAFSGRIFKEKESAKILSP